METTIWKVLVVLVHFLFLFFGSKNKCIVYFNLLMIPEADHSKLACQNVHIEIQDLLF